MSTSVAELLTRAFSDPAGVVEHVKTRLPTATGTERVELLRAMGNACRELRRIDESVSSLRLAVDEAAAVGERTLEGLASMSLAASLSYSGDFDESLRAGRRAVDLLDGAEHVAALSQVAGLLQRAGRNDAALDAFEVALALAEQADDPSIEADLRTNRGVLRGWAGDVDGAETDTRRALELYDELGWTKWAADMRHNLAWLAGRRGDLVEAFRRFDETEQTYESLGLSGASVFPDRAEALLAAGLTNEALTLAERAAAGLHEHGDDVDLAEALMLVARAALLAGDNDRAASASAEATDLFAEQDRAGWWAAAASLEIEARLRAGLADATDAARVEDVIAATAAAGLAPACGEAHLLAAELATEAGDWSRVGEHLAAVARDGLGLTTRCRYDLLRARARAAAGDVDAALGTCSDAVDEFGELTAQLGGTELRAHVALHVGELVDLGVGLAHERRDPGLLFCWAERQRAAALSAAPVRPPEDAATASDLDRLRAALTQLDASARDGRIDAELARQSAALQDRVRRRARHARRELPAVASAATVDDVADAGAAWISLVEIAGRLVGLRAVGGDCSMIDLGDVLTARREASMLRAGLAMHLNAVGRGVAKDPAIVLASAGMADELLLQPLGLPDGLVYVSPMAGLQDLPWGLLPSLADRPFVLAPSVALWRRCRDVDVGVPDRVVAVAGPGLPFAAAEATAVAACHRDPIVLDGPAATVAGVSATMAGADVVHVASHGHFSGDNPMFSSLRLADGAMFVYDIERIEPPPKVVVLSACHAGAHATPTGREVLGLTASLLASGPRAVVAATVPIPDTLGTVELMARLHTALAAGVGPADALLAARRADPIVGGAFATHGAG
jgi:tetratricopeptide (TPR) repeat protein